MVIRIKQPIVGNTFHALPMLIYAVVLVVVAVLNPLACVWHCALQEHAAEHGQRYVWICKAHSSDDLIADGSGGAAHISGGSLISAVHHGVMHTAAGVVLALLVLLLDRVFVLQRRACATIVPLSPPPKHTLRYA